MFKAVAILAMILLAAIPALAQDETDEELRKKYQGLPWEQAHVVETEHYKIRCNSTEEVTRRYADVMEKLFALYEETYPNLETKEMKWEVWVYSTRREFRESHPQRSEVTAGYYWPGEKRIYTYHGLFGVSGSTFGILAHEGVHAFQHSFLASYMGTPAWLREGMAVVLEGVEVDSAGKLSLEEPSRDRLLQVKLELQEKKTLELADVLGAGMMDLSRRQYAYAGMFVWWLAKGGDKQRKVLDELLAALTERAYQENDLENLLQKHMGKGLDEVEKEWHAWIRRQKVEYTGTTAPGGSYSSRLLRFSIKRPATDWAMDGEKAPVEGECIVYQRPRTGGRISVTAYANQLSLGADELYVQMLADIEEGVQGAVIESRERLKIKGKPGFSIVYTGAEPASKITTEQQRVQVSVIVATHHIYVIRMQCPPGKWEENREDFGRAADKLSLK
jgi:hypothetical protein